MDARYHEEWGAISRFIRELFNHHCARCGQNCRNARSREEQLQVHHIDENPANNDPENLIPLCARCHLQIEREARLHAPYADTQLELFEGKSYLLEMRRMRKQALAQYRGSREAGVRSLSPEEYEARLREWQERGEG